MDMRQMRAWGLNVVSMKMKGLLSLKAIYPHIFVYVYVWCMYLLEWGYLIVVNVVSRQPQLNTCTSCSPFLYRLFPSLSHWMEAMAQFTVSQCVSQLAKQSSVLSILLD